MSTPFEPPDTEPERPPREVYGTTQFTVSMMRSLRTIRLFHGVYGAVGAVLGVLSFSCAGLAGVPLLLQGAVGREGLVLAGVGMYLVAGVVLVGLSTWLLLGAWNLQRASTADDATEHVERGLRQIVRLWITVTIGIVVVVGAYAALIAWVLAEVGRLNPAIAP